MAGPTSDISPASLQDAGLPEPGQQGSGEARTLPGIQGAPMEPLAMLNALPSPILTIDSADRIYFLNQAAELFFQISTPVIRQQHLSELIPADSPIFSLIQQARISGNSVAEYGFTLSTPRTGSRFLVVEVAPSPDGSDHVVLYLQEQSIARKMGQQLSHRNAGRSVTAMAMMLAHEVKNPLSGIRGAAQLLEQGASPEDRELTRLICDETDRITALVNSMDVFAENLPMSREPVNIHLVLNHVRKVIESGAGRDVRIVEHYDPSLPPVFGNRDLLVQMFLNLAKNACEVVPAEGGEVVLSTSYQHGVRLTVPGTSSTVHLPLVVAIRDNGPGVPEDLRAHLFDPFVTSKPTGKGLGLALVAKVVGDHGGVIEFDTEPRRTVFRVMLPMYQDHQNTPAFAERPGRSTTPEAASALPETGDME